MDYWPENHRFPTSKFGTVPLRKCQNVCPERHQVQYPPVCYDAQQNYNRGFWTVPGCRTGGALQEYTNWTDPARHPEYPPVHLDSQQHQDQREYEPRDSRSRELMAPQRAGSLRDDWQRRWESSGSAHCTREASKRSNSSYRELEAWAARYSHSLPRRRRIEAELRGATQGPEEDFRALRPVQSFSGPWDRAARQPTHCHIQAPATYSSQNSTEKAEHQQLILSQPPGYIAPPAYDGPHKRSPVKQTCDVCWDEENRRQSLWPQPTLRQQHLSLDLQENKKENSQILFTGLKGKPLEVVQETLPNVHYQCLRIPAAKNTSSNKTPSKVIEGRKFSINKRMGGLTIFCLVSRTAGTMESPTAPPDTQRSNEDVPVVSSDLNEIQKIADEVDFSVPTLTETAPQDEATLEEKQPNKIEESSLMIESKNEALSICEKQLSSAKYPLWKEPNFSSKFESPPYPGASSAAETSQVDMTESEPGVSKDADTAGSHLVIDTTCVVVKMETVPSPEKRLVHYVDSDKDEEKLNDSEAISETVEESETSVSERESLEERAERILGIPLHDSVSEVPPEEEAVVPTEHEKEEEDRDGATLGQNIEPEGSDEVSESLVGCTESNDESETRADSNDDIGKCLLLLPPTDTNQPDPELSSMDTPILSSSTSTAPSPSPGDDELTAVEPKNDVDHNDQTSLSEALVITEEQFEDDPSINEVSLSEKQELVEMTTTDCSGAQEPKTNPDECVDACECAEAEKVENGPSEELLDKENSDDVLELSDQTAEENGLKETEVDSIQDEAVVENLPAEDTTDGPSTEHSTHKEADVASEAQLFPAVMGQDKTPGDLPESQYDSQETSSPDVDSHTQCSEPLAPSSPSPQAEIVPEDFSVIEQSEYPKSLWDAVNRIRRHTAPDSENEEEEVGELWDPECGGPESYLDAVLDQQTREDLTVFEEPTLRPVSAAGVDDADEEEPTQTDPDGTEFKTQKAEDDSVSCSSNNSGDTVIDAEEDEVSDTTSGADVEFTTVGEERRSSGEVDNTTDGEERTSDEDEADGECMPDEESKTCEGKGVNNEGTEIEEGPSDAIEDGGHTPELREERPEVAIATPQENMVITETMRGLDHL